MELNREQIIKALECCSCEGDDTKSQYEICWHCPYFNEGNCTDMLKENALALIKERDEQIFKLENRLKECENGYEGTLFLKSCKLHDAEEKVKVLNEENERLRADAIVFENALEIALNSQKQDRADTVREFAERIKAEKFHHKNFGDLVYLADIDQIAKEMLED